MIVSRHFQRINWGSQIPFSCSQSRWGVGGGLNSDAASCKIFIISKCFHRSKQELKKYSSIHWRCQKFKKTIGAYTESTDLIFKALKKLFISWHCPFNNCKNIDGPAIHLRPLFTKWRQDPNRIRIHWSGWSTINIFGPAYQRGKLVLVEETREKRANGMRGDGMRNKDIH